MLNLKLKAAEAVVAAAKIAFPEAELSASQLAQMMEYPPNEEMGDLALPCFQMAKALRMAPPKIAAALAAHCASPAFASVEVAGGYLNFKINYGEYAESLCEKIKAQGERYGSPETDMAKQSFWTIPLPTLLSPSTWGTSEQPLSVTP